MPPKRDLNYVGVMDPVEKQYVKMHEEKPKKNVHVENVYVLQFV